MQQVPPANQPTYKDCALSDFFKTMQNTEYNYYLILSLAELSLRNKTGQQISSSPLPFCWFCCFPSLVCSYPPSSSLFPPPFFHACNSLNIRCTILCCMYFQDFCNINTSCQQVVFTANSFTIWPWNKHFNFFQVNMVWVLYRKYFVLTAFWTASHLSIISTRPWQQEYSAH